MEEWGSGWDRKHKGFVCSSSRYQTRREDKELQQYLLQEFLQKRDPQTFFLFNSVPRLF